jgi:hypothetical protein
MGLEHELKGEDLAEALAAPHRADLLVRVRVDLAAQQLVLYRGNRETVTAPFSLFRSLPNGPAPDFADIEIIDCGQTIRLGEYEAAVDALLYDLDPDYRRRANT